MSKGSNRSNGSCYSCDLPVSLAKPVYKHFGPSYGQKFTGNDFFSENETLHTFSILALFSYLTLSKSVFFPYVLTEHKELYLTYIP